MPHFNVQIHEEELDGKAEGEIIRVLADAIGAVYGERLKALAAVEVCGIPRHRWGLGGTATAVNAPVITLRTRESALAFPGVGDPPARLIASITDAMVAVFGESIRPHVTVLLIGVPAGRSGVGGEVV